MYRFATVVSRGVQGTWLETNNMPSNFKKLIRARMAKTGERYQTAARRVRASNPLSGPTPELPSQSIPDGRALAPLVGIGANGDAVSIDSPTAKPPMKSTLARITNLPEIRAAARQFRIDLDGSYDIAVDATTLACSAVPIPWFTLRECGGRRTDKTLPFEVPAGFRKTMSKRIRVFIVDSGLCIGTTSMAGGQHTKDELVRFMVAQAACKVAPGCRLERDIELEDWAWSQWHQGNRVRVTRHKVADADLAHEREAELRAAVAAGMYPILLTVGAKRAFGFVVMPKPILPNHEDRNGSPEP